MTTLSLPSKWVPLTEAIFIKSLEYVMSSPDNAIYQSAASIKEKQLLLLQLAPSSVAKKLGLLEYFDHDDRKTQTNMRAAFRRGKITAADYLAEALGLPTSTSTPKKSTGRRGAPSTTGRNVPTIVPCTPEPGYNLVAPGGGGDVARVLFSALGEMKDVSSANQRDIKSMGDSLGTHVGGFIQAQVAWNQRQEGINEEQGQFNERQDELNAFQEKWNRRAHKRIGKLASEHDDRLSELERAVGFTPPRHGSIYRKHRKDRFQHTKTNADVE